MPTLEFLNAAHAALKTLDAPEGGDLVDLCDRHLAPVPFSCRSASCGTCQVEVVSGGELLEAPGDSERELLELLGGPPEVRLACQARVRPGPGLLRVKPLGT